jgi:hypothetical protein
MQTKPLSGVIQVDMEVIRCDLFDDEDQLAQLWGYVADYQVSVWLPSDDPRVQHLLGKPILPPKENRNSNCR